MKKLSAIFLVFALTFGLFGCTEKAENSDETASSAQTTTRTTAAEKITGLLIKALHVSDTPENEGRKDVTLSPEDTEYISEILKTKEWADAGSDCLFDYSFEIDGETYYYHSDCGTINTESDTHMVLYEADRLYLNSILGLTEIKEDSIGSDAIQNFWNEFDPDDHLCAQPTYIAGTTISFGLKLLNFAMKENRNALVSPFSVLSALSMSANGAKGDTLTQMESVLGGKISMLNDTIMRFNEEAEKHEGVTLANSVWFNNKAGLNINKSFTDTVRSVYGAELFSEDFNRATLEKINRWIELSTDGTIKDMLKDIPSDAVAYLINTVLFDAEWVMPYSEFQVKKDMNFTAEDGSVKKVDMLQSAEDMSTYFRIGKVQGFCKSYKNGYRFMGILPDEGVSVEQALDSFTAHQLCDGLGYRFVEFAEPYPVLNVWLPKFEIESQFRLSDTLKKMGMPLAFSPSGADFSGMATSAYGNIYIDEVFHNTFISLGEKGTKAGAATVVTFKAEGIMQAPTEIIELKFDRPFIYAILSPDNTPLFMGVINDL